jgi:hypothetical protein
MRRVTPPEMTSAEIEKLADEMIAKRKPRKKSLPRHNPDENRIRALLRLSASPIFPRGTPRK